MIKYFTIFLVFLPIISFTQDGYGKQWVFWNFNRINFNNDTVIVDVVAPTEFEVATGCFPTSICNKDGELLFSTGGCYVLNKENQVMLNGDSINSDFSHASWCEISGDFPISQGATILPYPNNNNQYLIFNYDLQDPFGTGSSLPVPLHLIYHVVDMTEDNGLGAVVEKKQIAIQDTLDRGYLTSVRHNNGQDWWLIAPKWNSNCYHILPVTKDGIGQSEIQCLGEIWNDKTGGGQAVFSPDGTKYARIEAENGWYLFDFDNEAGILSNPLLLMDIEEINYYRGTSFSPNSRYLYVNNSTQVFQFDLMANNIVESISLVGEINTSEIEPGMKPLALSKLAPNNKIYISSPSNHRFLSVINNPNCEGTSCRFEAHVLELLESNCAGLSNLPNFYIPPSDNNCDSINTSIEVDLKNSIKFYPNPAVTILTVEIPSHLKETQLFIYNSLGQIVLSTNKVNKQKNIDIGHLPTGIYFIGNMNLGVQKWIKMN